MPEDLSTQIPLDAWMTPSGAPRVRPLEMHLWRCYADVANARIDELASALPEEEKARAARLRQADARRHYVAGRTVLRRVLAMLLRTGPETIRFAYSAAGKPSIASPAPTRLQFSLSHAGDMILIAVASGTSVGADVERVRPVVAVERIARRIFEARTLGILDGLTAEERERAFLHAWTQREAVVKALGGRLFTTADPLAFSWPRRSGTALHADSGGMGKWTLVTPELGNGWIATAVATDPLERVRSWTVPLDASAPS